MYKLHSPSRIIAFLGATIVFLQFFYFISLSSASQEHKKNILLLSSYHVGYKWSDEIYQGTLDVIQSAPAAVALYTEFMDMKRSYSENRFSDLYQSFSHKYRDITIDYVLSSDDTAFLFLKKYADDLFPGATVIFCGTNYIEPQALEGIDNFYGITEKADIAPTLELMLSVHPDTKNIFIINEYSFTGRIVQKYFDEAANIYKDRVNFITLNDLPMERLLDRVGSLPPQSLIFFTFFLRDSAGETFEYRESISLIAERARVPIYGAWDFNLGLGIVGGMLTSGYHQGRSAGELALRFFSGEEPSSIPRISQSPNRYMFDYAVLKKHSISISKLPSGSILINRPETFYERHKKVLVYSAASITALLMIIFALIVNIVKRKKAERDLLQSERNFRGIFENAQEGLFQVNYEGQFLKVNDSLAKILKCDSPYDVLETYKDLQSDLHVADEQRQHIIQQVREKGSTQMEIELFCKDRSKVTVLLNCHEVVDDKNKPLYLEGSLTDMTEYKMTQEIIIQTEKMVSLGGLSAGIAHEIKNPLTSIIQASLVISSRLLDDSPANIRSAEKANVSLKNLKSYLEDRDIPLLLSNINDSGQRANVIIEDMLSFSKKTIGEFSNEAVAEIIHEAVDLAKKDYNLLRGYTFNSITVDFSFPESIPPLYCSRTKLRQVLFNLLKNSAEAMAEAQTANPRIDCSIEYDDETITLRLQDNGPGMEANVKERIFEPFYSTKGNKKGTGLGLSIAYFIITENHKGKMSVDTKPGKGACFILDFPILNTQPHEAVTSK